MDDESQCLSGKSWARAADVINKVGYMDGASDGQTSTFQSSFDKGYSQGFSIGLSLGYYEAIRTSKNEEKVKEEQLTDPRKINCQLCLNRNLAEENVVNLFSIQKENNNKLLKKLVNR